MPRVITLTDGPHVLNAPTGREVRDLQRLGYPIDTQFSVFTLFTNITESESGKPVRHKDSTFDLTAIADHIAVLMRDPEWDADRVAEHFAVDALADYFKALVALGNEAFGGAEPDPKASSGNSPA
jgi:hypothetical protein